VSVAERGADPVFAVALKPTDPFPEPPALPSVNHPALLEAVHEQPPGALTETVPLPPATATEVVVDVALNVHPTPACVTLAVWPPTVIVAVRLTDDVLASAVSETVPLPAPAPPAVILSQVALLDAVQEQPVAEVTLSVPLPPPVGAGCVAGERP
jgi:hypothetical protein